MTGYWAADGFEKELEWELGGADERHGRLFLKNGPPIQTAWAQNIWLDPRPIAVTSIGDAAKKLLQLGRLWAQADSRGHHRRAALIAEKLPRLRGAELEFLGEVPRSRPGSWMLLEPNLLLASPQCTSLFPNGDVRFKENRDIPPSRAYLKLWETFTVYGVRPRPGQLCLDLGSSPGGWTWVLQSVGARVLSVDRAPLDAAIARLPGIEHRMQNAFALKPEDVGSVDWLFSDIICDPARLLELIQRWRESGLCRNFVCTLKFKGATDHETARRFQAIPGSRLLHLAHNKHELTWILAPDSATESDPVAK